MINSHATNQGGFLKNSEFFFTQGSGGSNYYKDNKNDRPDPTKSKILCRYLSTILACRIFAVLKTECL
jgi:hypothetical protein